jgi:hypothetical protein
VAIRLTVLARIVERQGDSDTALAHHQRALVVNEQTYGPNHPAVATSLFNAATTLCNRHEYAAARPLLVRALGINEQAYSPDHPDVVVIRNELAKYWPS